MNENLNTHMFNVTQRYEAHLKDWIQLRMDRMELVEEQIMQIPASERTDAAILHEVTFATQHGADYGVIADFVVTPDKKMLSGDGYVPEPGYDYNNEELL